MSKIPAKVSLLCPLCGFEQKESPLARSTFCRGCSEYFAIVAGAAGGGAAAKPKPVSPPRPAAPPQPQPIEETPYQRDALPVHHPVRESSDDAPLLERVGRIFSGPAKSLMARCFECNGVHEVCGSAHSTTCRDCGAYIDLQDYKITGSFSRNIITRGTLFLGPKGDLSSTKIVCSAATILGRLRGNITCSGKVVIRSQGRVPGTVEAGCLVIEKGSDVDFIRPVKVAGMEIYGAVRGEILSGGPVTIYKSGLLAGAVRARGFSVEKGGCFEGELTISPHEAVSPVILGGGGEKVPIEPARRLWQESSDLIGQDPLPGI